MENTDTFNIKRNSKSKSKSKIKSKSKGKKIRMIRLKF